MFKHIVLSLAALTLTASCDPDTEARALDLEALADPDLDPEIRAHLEAELAASAVNDADATKDAARPGVVGELGDPGYTASTCFFCPQPQPLDPGTYTPVVLNPSVSVNAQGNTILFMQAASSFIVLPGATVRLQSGAQSFGPYALSFDVSGTLIRANVSGGFPNNTCRTITVTNPNNKSSAPVDHCR